LLKVISFPSDPLNINSELLTELMYYYLEKKNYESTSIFAGINYENMPAVIEWFSSLYK
jgi:hypothetical protein